MHQKKGCQKMLNLLQRIRHLREAKAFKAKGVATRTMKEIPTKAPKQPNQKMHIGDSSKQTGYGLLPGLMSEGVIFSGTTVPVQNQRIIRHYTVPDKVEGNPFYGRFQALGLKWGAHLQYCQSLRDIKTESYRKLK
ncbi:conserved hypothetical protein [Ricinus communis]|uniref:Uncharacterized protein n=1 Tax=Ricinus communis TaxID=3988 RepID=B9SRA0_RICCO|nr:conserved hypothetical protein [Ricinus communis]